MTRISNSEVGTFLKCERRHYYAHGLRLAPNNYGTSLTRGIIGHEALAAYYQAKKDGNSEEDCREAGINAVAPHFANASLDSMQMLTGLIALLRQYWEEVSHPWNIIAVEQALHMPLGGDDFEYSMRFDMLVEMTGGQHAGEVVLVDHKFVYNFWTPDNLMLNMQAPKYIATARYNDIPVKRLMINQLRWREVKSNPERFRNEWLTPGASEIKQVMYEQAAASERIIERMVDLEAYGKTALRTMDHMTCTNCSFSMLCRVELIGEDPTYLISTDFKPNTYGYDEGDDSGA